MIDSIRQLERLIDFRVRIKRHEECVDKKVERSAAHRQSPDFDALQSDCSAAVGGLNSRDHFYSLFALDQFRHQPVGFFAGALAEFDEVYQRGSGCAVVAEFQV